MPPTPPELGHGASGRGECVLAPGGQVPFRPPALPGHSARAALLLRALAWRGRPVLGPPSRPRGAGTPRGAAAARPPDGSPASALPGRCRLSARDRKLLIGQPEEGAGHGRRAAAVTTRGLTARGWEPSDSKMLCGSDGQVEGPIVSEAREASGQWRR